MKYPISCHLLCFKCEISDLLGTSTHMYTQRVFETPEICFPLKYLMLIMRFPQPQISPTLSLSAPPPPFSLLSLFSFYFLSLSPPHPHPRLSLSLPFVCVCVLAVDVSASPSSSPSLWLLFRSNPKLSSISQDMKMMPLLSRKKLYKFVSSSLHVRVFVCCEWVSECIFLCVCLCMCVCMSMCVGYWAYVH